MGSMVGVKYARRSMVRPLMRPFTHIAMTSASAMEGTMVPAANIRLFFSAIQKIGSATMSSYISSPIKRLGLLPRGVLYKLCQKVAMPG